MSNLRTALPTTFRSKPVIPYPPNGPDNRGHSWDWTGLTDQNAAGLTAAITAPPIGVESWTLRYVGLTRADARAIESFVETQAGRYTGFWCPTFQADWHATACVGDNITVREWGFQDSLYPVTYVTSGGTTVHLLAYFAAYRAGVWALNDVKTFTSLGTDAGGFPLVRYGVRAGATNSTVWSSAPSGAASGLFLSRLLYVRLADDAMTTTWDHPGLANIALRVVALPRETPTPS